MQHVVVRRVLGVRDAATWNFHFATSTPLPGRYDWRPSGRAHADEPGMAEPGRPAAAGTAWNRWIADRDEFDIRRRRPTSTARHSSARRRLVFNSCDLAAADRAVTNFLVTRLTSSSPCYTDTPQQLRSRDEPRDAELPRCPVSAMMPPPTEVFDDDDQRHPRSGPSDVDNWRVGRSDRRTTRRTMKRRTGNRSLGDATITGEQALSCTDQVS